MKLARAVEPGLGLDAVERPQPVAEHHDDLAAAEGRVAAEQAARGEDQPAQDRQRERDAEAWIERLPVTSHTVAAETSGPATPTSAAVIGLLSQRPKA